MLASTKESQSLATSNFYWLSIQGVIITPSNCWPTIQTLQKVSLCRTKSVWGNVNMFWFAEVCEQQLMLLAKELPINATYHLGGGIIGVIKNKSGPHLIVFLWPKLNTDGVIHLRWELRNSSVFWFWWAIINLQKCLIWMYLEVQI